MISGKISNNEKKNGTVQKNADPIGKSLSSPPIQKKGIDTNTVVQRNPLEKAGIQIFKTGVQKFVSSGAQAAPKMLPSAQAARLMKPAMPRFPLSGGGGVRPPLFPFSMNPNPGGMPMARSQFSGGGGAGGKGTGFGGYGVGDSINPNLFPWIQAAQIPKDEREEETDGEENDMFDMSKIMESMIYRMYSAKEAVSDGVSSGAEMVKSYVDESDVTVSSKEKKGKFSAEVLAKHSNVIGQDRGLVLTLSQYLGGDISIDGVAKSFSAAINIGAGFVFESKETWESNPIDVPGIGRIILKIDDRAFGMGVEVGAEAEYSKKNGASAGIYNKLKHSIAGKVNIRFADTNQEIFNASAKGEAVLKNDVPDADSSSFEFENVRVNVAVLENTPAALAMKDLMIRYDEFSEQNPTLGFD